MGRTYGYCRISTKFQNLERQVRNIKAFNQDAIIIEEAFTGKEMKGRKEFSKLLKIIRSGDTIIFDSVSRMSRSKEDGVNLYMKLFDMGVNLIFLKERHIDTDTYKQALGTGIQLTGTDVDDILIGVNKYMRKLATNQIILAFEQSQKEVDDLSKRTAEGIETARRKGKQIGGVKGKKLTTKKSIEAKEKIMKLSRDFNGGLADIDVINRIKISRNSYYKYKKELIIELDENERELIENLGQEEV